MNNTNTNNKSSIPPPIISNSSDNASNELPTPPSVPLSDPASFPSNTNTNSNSNNNNNKRQYIAAPQPHPQPQPPPHYNKYYPSYYHQANPMYNSYPIPTAHYPLRPQPHSYHHPSIPPRTPLTPTHTPLTPTHPPSYHPTYPTFNGITAKSIKPLPACAPHIINNHSNNTPSKSPSSSMHSTPKKLTPKSKINPPQIHPTFRPFYENQSDSESESDNDKNEMDIDNNNNNQSENDSDYNPANNGTHSGGKKKGKKKKKKKKKLKKKSKSKKGHGKGGKILHLASQQIYVACEECVKPTKALKWSEFRAWLKYNLEPYDHQSSIRKKQRELFTAKMKKLLSFCTYNKINNHGEICEYYCLWLQIPQKNKWIQLIISDGNWFTNCTSEQQMMGYTTNITDKDYYFFRVIEGHSVTNNIILLIRCDKGGNCGELVWLQKGINVSGTDALAIENAISSALDLRWVYLHDDSKIKYGGNTSRSQCNLYLKTIRSIAKGQSWYSQAFYRPFNCTDWPSQTNINGKSQTGVEPGTVFTQNAKEYKNSVNLIRSFKIKKLRKLLIFNTDFSKKGEKSEIKKKMNKSEEDGDNFIYPVMHPSDLKKFDEVLASMNEYDPYFEIHGKPQRLNKNSDVNPKYFFNFSEDEIDSGNDTDNHNHNHNTSPQLQTPPNHNHNNNMRRQTRSRSKRDPSERKKEKLNENNKICVVRRWHKRRIKVKHSLDSASEYVHENTNNITEYRRQCVTIGDLAAVLYSEGNPEAWGHNKNYGLKLIRCAKENLIKFFQHILTSAENKEIKHLTPQFKSFHKALKSIENTKIFGKRSKRWAQKMSKMQKQQQQNMKQMQKINNNNNKIRHNKHSNTKDNPIHILSQSQSQSQSQSPNKNKRKISIANRQKSTEPLMDIAMERQNQINAQIYYRRQQHAHAQRYYNMYGYNPAYTTPYHPHAHPHHASMAPMAPAPHWSYRGYPSVIGRHASVNGMNGYFNGFNRELRNELAGDAQKLKLKQIQEKRRLDDHKTFLKKDLDSHLKPTGNRSRSGSNSNSNSHNKHKLLFESLKGPSHMASKKTVQPPLRVHRNLVDTISTKQNHNQNSNNNNNSNDTDSTLSTINNDSDSTINANTTSNNNVNISNNNNHNNNNNNNVINHNLNINISDNVNIENTHASNGIHASNASNNKTIHHNAVHVNAANSNANTNAISNKKTHMTRAQTRKKNNQQISGHKRHINHNMNKQPPNKRIKLDKIQLDGMSIPKQKSTEMSMDDMNSDELISEIKRYDKSFSYGIKWCRFCGCKASNNWNIRNRMILCQYHDIEYEKNKKFRKRIDKYKKIPRKPIDISKNTEYKYLQSKLKLELSKQKNM